MPTIGPSMLDVRQHQAGNVVHNFATVVRMGTATHCPTHFGTASSQGSREPNNCMPTYGRDQSVDNVRLPG